MVAVAALLSAPLARTQTGAPAPVPVISTNASLAPKLTGIAHVAIRVADVDASRAFYQKLGYAQPFVFTAKDGHVTESFVKIDDRQYIELYPSDAAHPPAFLHVCFEAQNLPGLYPIYTANGVVANPVKKAGAGNLLMAWKGVVGRSFKECTARSMVPASRASSISLMKMPLLSSSGVTGCVAA